jgi:pyrimidine operon attenuation protein/uracil phosphoribosyltransferase
MSERLLMTYEEVQATIYAIADKIIADIEHYDQFALIGIQTRGVYLAQRLQKIIKEKTGKTVKIGILDITFYRDDLASRGILPKIKETAIKFDIADMTLLLVDDVLFTGRTVKAALENLTSFGRPKKIKLCALIDRGNRELPIQPDYCGIRIDTQFTDNVVVWLKESDQEDKVFWNTD